MNSGAGGGSSVNFGPGIELLMNDKKRNASNNINIDLGDLDKLENDLNELSGNTNKSVNMGKTGGMPTPLLHHRFSVIRNPLQG